MGEMTLAEKKKLLNNLVKKTQTANGGATHVLAFAGTRSEELKYEFISTPSENVNMALGDGTNPGGFARGKIGEILGETGSGKTSFALETIGKDMKSDPDAMWGWLDTEGDFVEEYAVSKGIDMDRLLLWEVDDVGAEKGLDTLEMLIRSHTLKGIFVNSVTGLTPKTELENLMEKAEVAVQARMMSKLMRKITAISNRTKTSVIFINQLRAAVGVKYGNPETTTGGKALSFFASQRVELRKVKLQKEDNLSEEEGLKINVSIRKNRAAKDNPYKKTSFTVLYGIGVDYVRELGMLAQDAGFATSGSWIYMNDTKTATDKNTAGEWNGEKLAFNGKAKFLAFIRANPDFQEHIKTLLRGNVKIKSLSTEEIVAIEEEEAVLAAELGEFHDI